MPEEITDAATSAAPAASTAGKGALNSLKGFFGFGGSGKLGAIKIAVGGKTKIIIPAMIVLVIFFGAVFFLISAIAVYASRLGAVPGYAGGITSGTCPSTKGWLVKNDTFDETGDQIDVVSVPDISQATQTETVTAHVTTYCPAEGSTDADDIRGEGGEMAGPMGIKLGIGAVAMPKDPDRFPTGRTVVDIPGVGLRVAVDVGSAINTGEAGADIIDIDVFSGWSTNIGDRNCNKHSDKWITGGDNVAGVKVYVFKDRTEAEAKSYVKHYDNQPACLAANSPASFSGGTGTSGNALSFAQAEIGNHDWTRYTNVKDMGRRWCAYFVTWVYKAAGFDIPSMGGPGGVRTHFKNHGMIWIDNPSANQIMPGDMILFSNAGSFSGTHIGIVESVSSDGTINTIEGNSGRRTDKVTGAVLETSSVKRQHHKLTDTSPKIEGVGRAK